MKKLPILFMAGMLSAISAYGGGIVTNTNQSASWARNPSRDASTSIDAVYYNPAGLGKLGNGFYFSFNNQYITQKKEVENFYKGPGGIFGLKQSSYKGDVKAPLFPGIYAIYKLDKLAFSFGFNPIGGGGSAKFNKGLPSLELSASDLVPALYSQGATDYSLDTYFKGSSVYFGYQAGLTYSINDIVSVFGGVRYVTVDNTYQGYLKNVMVLMSGTWVRADNVMNGIAAQAGTAGSYTQSLVNGGAGGLTFAQAEAYGLITSAQQAQLEAGLAAFGGDPSTATISQADAIFDGANLKYSATANLLRDQEADVEQKGSGFCPIIGVNISPAENLNIGIKYEFATKMYVKNHTTKDFTTGYTWDYSDSITMFPDGEKIHSDMPAMLAVGVSYGINSKLNISAGMHYFFDRSANYGKKLYGEYETNDVLIDKNFYEISAGLEYKLTDKILVSGGYLCGITGVNDYYQTDMSYSNSSSTVCLGGAFTLNEKVTFNLGASYSIYKKYEKEEDHLFSPTGDYIPMKETLWKNTLVLSVGADISLGK